MWGALYRSYACCPINRARFRADWLAVVDALLAAGGNLNARGDDGRTILLYLMTMWNDRDFMEGLLTRGADARVRDNHGDTALTLLIKNSLSSLAKDERIPLLIAAGVDVNAKDSQGKSALDVLRVKASSSLTGEARDATSVMGMLIAAGAK
jgi:ankyrin repeat protein